MIKRDLRTARYFDLIEQLADEAGRVHGWKRKVAGRLGVSASYLTQLAKRPNVTIGDEAANAAARHLGISPSYFRSKKPSSYKEFIVSSDFLGETHDASLDAALARATLWVEGQSSDEGVWHAVPSAQDARKFAIDLSAWADAEYARVKAFRAAAQGILISSDADVVARAQAVAYALWNRYGTRPVSQSELEQRLAAAWDGPGEKQER